MHDNSKLLYLRLFDCSCVGEAVHLAKDFHRLCDNYFPCDELAHMIASQHAGTPEAQHRISMVKATQYVIYITHTYIM